MRVQLLVHHDLGKYKHFQPLQLFVVEVTLGDEYVL